MDLKKATLTDVQKLNDHEFDYFKRIVKQEEQRRTEPEFEEVDLYYLDDGCEGNFFTIDDFEACARDKGENDYDLIDYIVQTLEQGSDVRLYPVKQPMESMQGAFFFGKENPYEDRFDEDGEFIINKDEKD